MLFLGIISWKGGFSDGGASFLSGGTHGWGIGFDGGGGFLKKSKKGGGRMPSCPPLHYGKPWGLGFFFTNLSLMEFQVGYLAIFLLFSVIDGFK